MSPVLPGWQSSFRCQFLLLWILMWRLRGAQSIRAFWDHTTSQRQIFVRIVSDDMEGYLRSQTSVATNARNTIAITPFIVKNAALRRRKSRGETIECS